MSDEVADNLLFFRAPGFADDDLVVLSIRGFEEISTPYEFDLDLECTIDGALDAKTIDDLLAANVSLGFGPHGERFVHGVLSDLELLAVAPGSQWSRYRARLVPRFWKTTLTHRSRCFVETSIPDVLREVLEENGLSEGTDFELRIEEGNYSKNKDRQVVQYQESDFNFLSRWMERLGMFYFFEQGDRSEKLIIADTSTDAEAVPEHAQVNFAGQEEIGVPGSLYQLSRRTRRRPAKLHVRDYNWRQSAKTHIVHGEHPVDDEAGFGLQAYYGEHIDSDKDGDDPGSRRAQIRAEAWMAGKNVYSARSANYDFAPGYRFTLSDPPLGSYIGESPNADFLIVRIEHEAEQERRAAGSGYYRNRFEGIERSVPYRAPQRAPWPRIDGVMHAKIDAEEITTAAPVDDKGRYRVLLPYDLYGKFNTDPKSKELKRKGPSCWIRMAKPYSGPRYGIHFSLHAGAEVLLAHIDGDPDRPIIVGTVPNDKMLSPIMDTHATRSGIRTRSGIFMDFEDDA